MELDHPNMIFRFQADQRLRIPEPPPVRLVTIDDAHLPAAAGSECELDTFYVGLLRFEREPDFHFPIYRAENFRVIFDVLEPPIERETLRPLGIEVPSLGEIEQKLLDAEIKYVRQRGLMPGQESILLRDPAGNWVQIEERRELR
jgi:hypothetical protein